MIFVARQVVEKVREHRSDLFVLFVDCGFEEDV